MRNYQEKEATIKTQELHNIVCNKCGKHFTPSESYKIHDFEVSFNYNSGFDMEHWKFDLCEDCIIELIKMFKIVPDGFKSDNCWIYKHDTNPILHQELFDEWKQTGKWNWGKDSEEEYML